MSDAFRELLSGLIDYAGLFPPAALPLEPALERYLEYRRGPDRWMLGRFICPVSRLSALAEQVEARRELLADPPLPISAILAPEVTPEETLAEVRAIAATNQRLAGVAAVESAEVRLPVALVSEARPSALGDALERARHLLTDHGTEAFDGPVFWERPLLGELHRDALEALIGELERFNVRHASSPPWGLKLRCGGLEAAAIPDPRALAVTVSLCQRRGVPFKATAGLHHPLRRHDAALRAKTHGFLNLFVGAVLAGPNELGEPHLGELMEDESAGDFRFEGDRLAWRSYEVDAAQVREQRRALATSFGSCSFDEPREDLVSLGLLEST